MRLEGNATAAKISLRFGDTTGPAPLNDTETVRAFAAKLPVSIRVHGTGVGFCGRILFFLPYVLGIPAKVKKMAWILSSGAHGAHAASKCIYRGFIQGYCGAGDCGIFTAAGAENKSAAKLEESRAFSRSL